MMTTESIDSGRTARRLELYVAGATLNSRRAQKNLDEILKRMDEPFTLDVIDVLDEPKAALERRIFVTPSLVSTLDQVKVLIVGDLSDYDAVVKMLKGRR